MPVIRQIATYVGRTLVTMVLVTLLASLVVRLVPGNPAVNLLGQRASPEAVATLSRQLGLNRSLLHQILSYFGGVLHGDLGASLTQQGVPVSHLVFAGLGVTLRVVLATVVLSLLVGVPLGLLSAMSARRVVDAFVRGLSVLLLASPPFFIGLLLILVASLELHLFPAGGWGDSAADHLKSVVLPAIALSCYLGPIVVRAVRQAAIAASRQAYVEATLSRGVSSQRVIWGHILPNSLLPLITVVGVNVGWLISGAVVIEAVFALPGLGTLLARSVSSLDYTVIQGTAIVSAFVVAIANLLADVLYTVVDPRTRRRG